MIAELLDALAGGVEAVIDTLGLPGVTLIAFLENLFPPTPSEILYPLAGKLAHDGELVAWGVIVAGVIGSLLGSLIYYGVGYWLGRDRVRGALARYGRVRVGRFQWTIVSVDEYDRAMALFDRRGGVIVLIARLMPLVHGAVSIPAGVVRMPLGPFVFYTALGSALWIAPLTLLGVWLGANWERALYWIGLYENIWYGLIAAAIAYFIYGRVRNRQLTRENEYSEQTD